MKYERFNTFSCCSKSSLGMDAIKYKRTKADFGDGFINAKEEVPRYVPLHWQQISISC